MADQTAESAVSWARPAVVLRQPSREIIRAARDDAVVFAEALIGEPLWDHQADVARSPARFRVVCSGRQAGKSRTLAVIALHEAYRRPDTRVLVISAGDDAAKGLLAEMSALSNAALLAGAKVDDTKSEITLTNGSTIRSVPASQKQVRGRSVDLLILDEAAYIENEIWLAAKFTLLARPGSRVVMASTPWGRKDRFFAVAYRAGVRGEHLYESFHWPSAISPLVDAELLDEWRRSSTDREYQQEVLAEWVDDAGAYFTAAELDGGVRDYDLVAPSNANGMTVVGGVDWGFATDANALALLAPIRAADPLDRPDGAGTAYWVPWLEERFNEPYAAFIGRVVDCFRPGRYRITRLLAEANGVGAMPTQELAARRTAGLQRVEAVHTTNASKETAFGTVKLLLQQGRLLVPRHPPLLAQLSALEFETRESGAIAIAVPARMGHDDLAMALALAVSAEGERVLARPRRRRMLWGQVVERATLPPSLSGRGPLD